MVVALFLGHIDATKLNKKIKKEGDPDLKDYQDDSDFICDGQQAIGAVNNDAIYDYIDSPEDESASAPQVAPAAANTTLAAANSTISSNTTVKAKAKNATTNTTN